MSTGFLGKKVLNLDDCKNEIVWKECDEIALLCREMSVNDAFNFVQDQR